MEQRVSVVEGKKPFLLVAPSGANDKNTDVLTEIVASKLNSYAVINWGWERSAKIDYLGGKADCNNVDHCRGIVYDEFLEPVIRFKNRILRSDAPVYQFIIQGISGNDLPPAIDIVVGDGSPNNTCDEWVKKIFVYMANIEGLKTHIAKSGSVLAGSKKTHLNQYFSHQQNRVQSMQLEIPLGLRKTSMDIDIFTDFLTNAINHLNNINEIQAKAILPHDYKFKIY
jgi:hypothetical protein